MRIQKVFTASLLLGLLLMVPLLASGCKRPQLPAVDVDITSHATNAEKPDTPPAAVAGENGREDIAAAREDILLPDKPVSGNTDFFQYLGLEFGEIEALLGLGEETEFQYELGYNTYTFANSSTRFIFPYNQETGTIAAGTKCAAIAVALKDIIAPAGQARISKNELEQYFSIENWPDSASWSEEDEGHDAPWSNVYTIWGKYCGYQFNVYLEAQEENKASMPAEAYFFFYYDSIYNGPGVK